MASIFVQIEDYTDEKAKISFAGGNVAWVDRTELFDLDDVDRAKLRGEDMIPWLEAEIKRLQSLMQCGTRNAT